MRSVIFDMDGTLADTARLTLAAFVNLTKELGIDAPDIETIRAAVGYSCPEFYYRMFPDLPDGAITRMGESVEREERRLIAGFGEGLLFPGVKETLTALDNKHIPIYVASTGSALHVNSVTDTTGIRRFFTAIRCGLPDKAGMIKDIIGHNDKNDFIMVGDMKKDVDGAKANGIVSIGALYGYCKEDSGFDRYVASPGELLDIINGEI